MKGSIKNLILCPKCGNQISYLLTVNPVDDEHNITYINFKDIKCGVCGEVFGIKENNIYKKEIEK